MQVEMKQKYLGLKMIKTNKTGVYYNLLEDGDKVFYGTPNIQDLMTLNEYKQCVWALIEIKL